MNEAQRNELSSEPASELDRPVSSNALPSDLFMCWKGFHVQRRDQLARHPRVKGYSREVTDALKVCGTCGGKVLVRVSANTGVKARETSP